MDLLNYLLDGNLMVPIIGFFSGVIGTVLTFETARKNQLIKMSELVHEANKELRKQLKEQEAECRKDSEALKVRIRVLEQQFSNNK